MRFRLVALAPLALAGVVAVGCGETTSGDCSDKGTCAPSPGGPTTDGAAPDGALDGAPPDAPPCPPQAGPKDNPCIVADAYGIFVSASAGNDGNPGTMEQPVATISRGIGLASSSGLRRVFVCAATYPEAISLSAGIGTIVVFGGLSCADWSYETTNVPLVAPPGVSACALQIANLGAHAQLVDMAFQAADATASGASSIAACLIDAGDVVLIRDVFTAGKGADGASAPPVSGPPPAAHGGANGADGNGGAATTCTCAGSSPTSSTGGAGGTVGVLGGNGSAGSPPLVGTGGDDGAGGIGAVGSTGTCTEGHHGAGGGIGTAGASATTLGSIQNTSPWWIPSPGLSGAPGGVAQGGGGGGASSTKGGGGGGCGGCGGSPGVAGTGGGSSIALASYDSTVELVGVSLTAASAGNGGSGGAGQPGAGGGDGGLGALASGGTGTACNGGAGGTGGTSGAGGGGAGGVSAGVFYHGTAPTQTGTSVLAVGKAGAGGAAGDGSSTGIGGVAQPVLTF